MGSGSINESYIRTAQQNFGNRATFLVGTAREFIKNPDNRLNNCDIILLTGLLHHLEDRDVLEVLELCRNILKPRGRLVCIEPTYLIHQSQLSRWFMKKDRGKNIRTEQNLKELIKVFFHSYQSNITTGLLRIPYTHIIIECYKDYRYDK